jgi:uncharacterized membrane protein YkoI
MKIIFLTAALFLCMNSGGYTQIKVPSAVKEAFNKKFTAAETVKWRKENSHEFEGEFRINGIKYSANFSDLGKWLETETTITFDQLPADVQNSFNEKHKRSKVVTAAKIETSAGLTKYEVEIKKGSKTKEFFYLSDGTMTNE